MAHAQTATHPKVNVYFSDWFDVDPEVLGEYGAFNVSLINDLPLFIDPFLLFTSTKPEYQRLHDGIIDYLKFLRDRSATGDVDEGLLRAWYMFPEVRQLWLGFSLKGNGGTGLGVDFARSLNANLGVIFADFGNEKVTRGSHLEKVCLVQSGVGRDNISDFTANLIKEYLLEYTQNFAQLHIAEDLRREVAVSNVAFDYDVRRWVPRIYDLPYVNDDYVVLTPRDILTRDDNWINRGDMLQRVENIAHSIGDIELRSEVNHYLVRRLAEFDGDPSRRERNGVYGDMLLKFPQLVEWYIKQKEDRGDEAVDVSDEKVTASEEFYIAQFGQLIERLASETEFYSTPPDTYDESLARLRFLKEEIENNDGYRIFYHKGDPITRESDVQILFRLTWFATVSDFNSEVNNGRGPVDFKVSRGQADKTLVEFKLAKNKQLRRNLEKQVGVYEKANRTRRSLTAIFYFNEAELNRVQGILRELKLDKDESVVLIDCRADNKPSASKA